LYKGIFLLGLALSDDTLFWTEEGTVGTRQVSDAKSRCNKKKTGILVPPLIGFLVLSMTTIDNI
jgi:hypothetical protein